MTQSVPTTTSRTTMGEDEEPGKPPSFLRPINMNNIPRPYRGVDEEPGKPPSFLRPINIDNIPRPYRGEDKKPDNELEILLDKPEPEIVPAAHGEDKKPDKPQLSGRDIPKVVHAAHFKHNLCGCFDNCCICIVTYFCPCYTAGKVAEAVGESCILHSLLCLCPIVNLVCRTIIRGKVRSQNNIKGSAIGDFCVSWLCGMCGLCQEAQETGAIGKQAMALEQVMERE